MTILPPAGATVIALAATLLLPLAAPLTAQAADQAELGRRLENKLASAFFQKADWHTDFAAARKAARAADKPIFVYFTRSYEP